MEKNQEAPAKKKILGHNLGSVIREGIHGQSPARRQKPLTFFAVKVRIR